MARNRHPIGTIIETKDRYKQIKLPDGSWEGLARHILRRSGVEIQEGDRVFFADGDKNNLRLDNLRRIHFNTQPVILLAHSRVTYTPGSGVNKILKNLGIKQKAIAA